MAEPSAKILRRTLDEALDGEADNIDRLSALPESVLLHILSGLELKEAAATSVLSTTWRDLFLQRPNIELAFDIYGNPSDRSRLFHIFTLFANRVLRQRNPEAPITSLKVSVKDFTKRMEEDYRSLLMSAAAAVYTYKVQQFDVDLGTYNLSTETSSIVLPPAMFTSETLTRLLLTLSVGWDVPENVWLPNLRYAHFIPYRLMHEDSIQRFLDGCPSLETLMFLMRVTTEDETEVKTLCISSSSLKLLMVDWDMIDETEMNITVKSESLERLTLYLKGGHNVNVDAPNLNFFSISGQVLDLNIIQGLPSINEAVLDVAYTFQVSDLNEFFTRSEKVCTFFRELQNLTLLSISEPIMEALYDSTMVMPTFRNMYKIKLIPDYSDDFPRERMQHVLFNLLESCPKLQVLSFERIMVFSSYFIDDIDFESVFPFRMLQNLKELEILDFRDREMEYKLIEFFINNGRSLEIVSLKKHFVETVALRKDIPKAIMKTWTPRQKKRLLSFLSCSEDCKIIFREKSGAIQSP